MDKTEINFLKEIVDQIKQDFPDTPPNLLLSIAVNIETNELLIEGFGLKNRSSNGELTPYHMEITNSYLRTLEHRIISIDETVSEISNKINT